MVGIVLLAVAGTAVAYPLWWDHRATSTGHLLVQRAFAHVGAAGNHRDAAARCPTGSSTAPGSSTALGLATRAVATTAHPGILEIPAIGLTAPVLGGLSNTVLDVAVGHDPATVWPGARGESLLLAHDVSYFSGLERVRPGDEVIWQLNCERDVFRVLDTTVTRPGATVRVPASASGLALVTCWPTNALFWTSQRLVVQTTLVERETLGSPAARIPLSPLVHLVVPAPPALAADGLSLADSGIPVGQLELAGSPSNAFAEGPGPLAAANAALRDDDAAERTAAAHDTTWWSALAVAGTPLPAPWSLADHTDVTLLVAGSTVQGAVLSSAAATVTLTVHDGTLLVSGVSG